MDTESSIVKTGKRKTNMNRAFEYYCAGWAQKDISKIMGINDSTLIKWIKDNNWDEKRKSVTNPVAMLKKNVTGIALYLSQSIEESITEIKESGVIKKLDGDALNQLGRLLPKIELKGTTEVEAAELLRDFLVFVESENRDAAKMMGDLILGYLQKKYS